MIKYQVGGKEFDDWTLAQDQAVQLLDEGVEYVRILQWDDKRETWGLLQELNLERGIKPDPHFNTLVLAPYYWRLRYGNQSR
tara:strand:- start:101 stop:346 length:246 start_codon:yes stop_codon:yes gene_type:complete